MASLLTLSQLDQAQGRLALRESIAQHQRTDMERCAARHGV
jgi:hypothetical protein